MSKIGGMLFLLAAILIIIFSGTVRVAIWDMPTPYPEQTFHTVNIIQFAKDVGTETDGALQIKVHSAGGLIKHPDIYQSVKRGQVAIGEFFLSRLRNENGVYGADTIPFLATDYGSAWKLWVAQREQVAKVLAQEGLMPLFAVPWPPQGLYTKKEIRRIEDLRGAKFRAYNASLENFAKLVGATPTQVEVPDIPNAFATNRVEMMITSSSTGANSKAWNYVSYFYDIQAWIPKNIVVVNKRSFDRLPDSIQKVILKQAEIAERRGWEMSKAETGEKVWALVQNGMKVKSPPRELVYGFMSIGEKMQSDWEKETGAGARAILDKFQAN